MAIGKKRSGVANAFAGVAARQQQRRQNAVALAQKAAHENIAGNRQLDTARAQAAPATLIHPSAPSRIGRRLSHDREMQEARFGEAARQREWQGEQDKLRREWQSGESLMDRTWRGDEAARQREWQGGEAKLTREQQMKLQQMQNAAALERQREQTAAQLRANRERLASNERIKELGLRGTAANNDYKLALQRLKNEGDIGKENVKGTFAAGRDAAKYAHEREKWNHDAQQKRADFEYEETFKDQQKRAAEDYKERQKIREENRKYGIPDGVELSNEDRAKILAGTHEYIGNTQQEKDQIKAYEDVLAGQLSQDERDAIQLEYDLFREEHPANRVQEIPIERRAPKQTEINGQTYILNNGKWEPLKDDSELEMRRYDALQKRMDNYELSLRKPYTITDMVADEVTGELKPKNRTVMRSEEEIAEMMRRKFPDAYPKNETDEKTVNPNGFSNEDLAWIEEQFLAGNLTDDELASLGLMSVDGRLVPIDYEAEAGSVAPANTNVSPDEGDVSVSGAIAFTTGTDRNTSYPALANGFSYSSYVSKTKGLEGVRWVEDSKGRTVGFITEDGQMFYQDDKTGKATPVKNGEIPTWVAAPSETGGGQSSQKFDITTPVNNPSEAKAKWKSRKD